VDGYHVVTHTPGDDGGHLINPFHSSPYTHLLAQTIYDDLIGRFHLKTLTRLRLLLLQNLAVVVHEPHEPPVDSSTWTDVESLAKFLARVRQ
jgi:hypothetical protein